MSICTLLTDWRASMNRTDGVCSVFVTGDARHTHTHTHTHTHPFNGPFSGTTQVSRYQKGKPIWILLKQETVSGICISWDMQVCTLLQTDNHASTPPLSVLQAGCPSCRPTNSVKALKASCLLQRISVRLQRSNSVLLQDTAS